MHVPPKEPVPPKKNPPVAKICGTGGSLHFRAFH
jgi:hypothetical protein